MNNHLFRYIVTLGGLLLLFLPPLGAATPDTAEMRAWIEQMKLASQGPFSRIMWFCADGQRLPPKAYACVSHGGGTQHGELNQQARALRANGYYVANVLAGTDPEAFLRQGDAVERFKQILIEQFLIRIDNGWIMRGAHFYRGALQDEDERKAAQELLLRLAQEPGWLQRNFLPLRTGARLLSHGDDGHSIVEIRQRTADLGQRDPGFADIRNKIHARPDETDIQRVRQYARTLGDPALATEYMELATLMQQVYSPQTLPTQLQDLERLSRGHPLLNGMLRQALKRLAAARDAQHRLMQTATLMAELRDRLSGPYAPGLRLAMLDTSLALETAHFNAGTELEKQLATASRLTHVEWLRAGIDAAYGTGLLSRRQRRALTESLSHLSSAELPATAYKRELDYLARVPAWANRQLAFHFQESVQRLSAIEPLARLFEQDQLRGSPLFFYTKALDGLLRDANGRVGVRKTLFGREVGSGIRALNPGIATGVLRLPPAASQSDLSPDGIYLLPETTSRLPPVAGIITAGEGNLLSHVQLLARNLGIPNVVIDDALVPVIRKAAGRHVLLAVSPAGSVELRDAPSSDRPASQETPPDDIQIRPDLEKLDLRHRDFIRLSDLRAGDSGRIVGPKAAKLGELHHHYPEAVADGLAIPFGAFRALLELPYRDSGMSMYDWMRSEYRALEKLPQGAAERATASETLRGRIHEWILHADPGPRFRIRLREAMARVFGIEGTYGVFVRSDTNIEDLPGFSGAGLNLTVPNVVGFEEVLSAISRVWASPFSRRAFAWRQGRMRQPEHVYPAVLLMRSVPADKSGVMITRDVDNGAPGWLSVAVNEGVGGVVDGQAAESLRIKLDTGAVRLMAQASMPWRRATDPQGGIEKVPASGADRVLEPAEIEQLVQLARGLPERFPPILDARGQPTAADIEFGFEDGKLALFQIRPFLDNLATQDNAYLKALDAGIDRHRDTVVDMGAPPEVAP